MSRYRRAPLCRFCWDRGHTSLHCPEAKAKAEKAKLALERNEPISYKESDALEIVERKKSISQNRACTYCSQGGHNSRGCTVRVNDIEACTKRLQEWRNLAVKTYTSAGYGVGAIVTHNGYSPVHGYSRKDSFYTCMITNISSHWMNYWMFNPFSHNGTSASLIEKLHDADYTKGYYSERPHPPVQIVYALCDDIKISRYEARNDKYTTNIISPSFASPFDNNFASYVTCRNVVESAFNGNDKKKPSRMQLIDARIVAA